MDDIYKINVAKTEFREAYNTGDVDRLLAVFGGEGFTSMLEGGPANSAAARVPTFAKRQRSCLTTIQCK